jgi:hypothetical protein
MIANVGRAMTRPTNVKLSSPASTPALAGDVGFQDLQAAGITAKLDDLRAEITGYDDQRPGESLTAR